MRSSQRAENNKRAAQAMCSAARPQSRHSNRELVPRRRRERFAVAADDGLKERPEVARCFSLGHANRGLAHRLHYSYTCPPAFAAYHLGMPLSRAYRVLMAQDLNVSRGCAFA